MKNITLDEWLDKQCAPPWVICCIERLRGAASDSTDLMAHPRSGGGSKEENCIHSEAGTMAHQGGVSGQNYSDLPSYTDWFYSDEGKAICKPLERLVPMDQWDNVVRVFVAGRFSLRDETTPQSGVEEGDWCRCDGDIALCDLCKAVWCAKCEKLKAPQSRTERSGCAIKEVTGT